MLKKLLRLAPLVVPLLCGAFMLLVMAPVANAGISFSFEVGASSPDRKIDPNWERYEFVPPMELADGGNPDPIVIEKHTGDRSWWNKNDEKIAIATGIVLLGCWAWEHHKHNQREDALRQALVNAHERCVMQKDSLHDYWWARLKAASAPILVLGDTANVDDWRGPTVQVWSSTGIAARLDADPNRILLDEVYFESGSIKLDETSKHRLVKLMQAWHSLVEGDSLLGEDPFKFFESLRFVVVGHADTRMGVDYNEKLSWDRATTVKMALQGLRASISAFGVGERDLKIPVEGDLQENRRVTVYLERRNGVDSKTFLKQLREKQAELEAEQSVGEEEVPSDLPADAEVE